ncbi:MAG: GntP family permease [Hyphomicrobiales bacterium]
MSIVIMIAGVMVLLVIAISRYKLHPFIVLIGAAFLTAFLSGLPVNDTVTIVEKGFGGVLGGIGLIIIFGTIIGVVLERSGAAVTMARTIVGLVGERFPYLTMSLIGYIVSIPVFCDSGYVILNALKESVTRRINASPVGMSVALATGLYATHTLVPPTPGPIAAAGNLGLQSNLAPVIGMGLVVAALAAVSGLLWARFVSRRYPVETHDENNENAAGSGARHGVLPSPFRAFAPIAIPICLIALASIAEYPSRPFGAGEMKTFFVFLGTPLNALIFGMLAAFFLLEMGDRVKRFSEMVGKAMVTAAPILLITGAGGAFGGVLKATDLGAVIGHAASFHRLGIFAPFLIAAALKTAQGSSTVALVTTSSLIAPILGDLSLDSEIGRVLVVMSIGAGAMTVSHSNDSFFWVVSQFSKMPITTAYRAQTTATLIQGLTALGGVYALSLILL